MKTLVPLTTRELSIILKWRSEIENWSDDKRVLSKIKDAHDKSVDLYLSSLQIDIVRGWCEQELGGHYGGGIVTNMEEHSILKKLKIV